MASVRTVKIGKKIEIGNGSGLVFIVGPCVIESEKHTLDVAERLREIADDKKVNLIFKASYDKANRSSYRSFRGPGLKGGLKVLAKVREKFGLPVLTDVHCREEIEPAADVVDILQIPAFLCRQTDLLFAAAKTKKIVNVKKGQFLAPWDVKNIVSKLEEGGCRQILLTERGVSFGYNNLVSDFRALPILQGLGYPVIYDATHSVQLPGGEGNRSGGQRQFVPALARAAAAVGCDGLFMETHENPDKALSDGPNAIALDDLPSLIDEITAIDQIVKCNA